MYRILSQLNTLRYLVPYVPPIHFNVILLIMSSSVDWFLLLRFGDKYACPLSVFLLVLYVTTVNCRLIYLINCVILNKGHKA
jgi:hypothetical protein